MRNPKEVIKAIWVKGLELNQEVLRDIRAIELVMREGKATTGSLTISDTEFKHTDKGYFKKNATLSMVLGYTDEAEPFGPYVIKTLKYTAGEDAAPVLQVTFQDMTHTLHKKQKSKLDFGSCEDIIKRRAMEAGLAVIITDSPKSVFTKSKPLVQANKTNAQVFQNLADTYGYVWGIKGKTLYFRPPIGLDELKEQKDVPVLSYRINDYSIMSVELEATYIRDNGRSGAKKEVRNLPIDIQCKEEEQLYWDAYRSGDTSKLPDFMGKSIPMGSHLDGGNQTPDEDDAGLSEIMKQAATNNDVGSGITDALKSVGGEIGNMVSGVPGLNKVLDQKTLDKVVGDLTETALPDVDSKTGATEATSKYAPESSSWTHNEPGSIQTMPGSPAGIATPADPQGSKDLAAAAWYRMATVLKGTLIPSIPSVKYKASQSIILAGLGERLSGKYRVVEVNLAFTDEGPISTTLQIEKKSYGPSQYDKKKIAEGPTSKPSVFNNGTGPGTGTGSPAIADKTDHNVAFEAEKSRWVDIDNATGKRTER